MVDPAQISLGSKVLTSSFKPIVKEVELPEVGEQRKGVITGKSVGIGRKTCNQNQTVEVNGILKR